MHLTSVYKPLYREELPFPRLTSSKSTLETPADTRIPLCSEDRVYESKNTFPHELEGSRMPALGTVPPQTMNAFPATRTDKVSSSCAVRVNLHFQALEGRTLCPDIVINQIRSHAKRCMPGPLKKGRQETASGFERSCRLSFPVVQLSHSLDSDCTFEIEPERYLESTQLAPGN